MGEEVGERVGDGLGKEMCEDWLKTVGPLLSIGEPNQRRITSGED